MDDRNKFTLSGVTAAFKDCLDEENIILSKYVDAYNQLAKSVAK